MWYQSQLTGKNTRRKVMSVAGQFSALPMESLIGGPLQAAATAQGT